MTIFKKWLNKKPGKKAKKNMATFGFNTFIIKPFLYKSINDFWSLSSFFTSILSLLLKTKKAK